MTKDTSQNMNGNAISSFVYSAIECPIVPHPCLPTMHTNLNTEIRID